MAKRECPNCKSTNVKAIPLSELKVGHMGPVNGGSHVSVLLALSKLAANFTVYPWLRCNQCGREWRQFESPH
jgi:hypothetical protein